MSKGPYRVWCTKHRGEEQSDCSKEHFPSLCSVVLVLRPRSDHLTTKCVMITRRKRQVGVNILMNNSPVKEQKRIEVQVFFINKRWYLQKHIYMTGTLLSKTSIWFRLNLLYLFWNINRYTDLSYQTWARNLQVQNSTPSPVSKLNLEGTSLYLIGVARCAQWMLLFPRGSSGLIPSELISPCTHEERVSVLACQLTEDLEGVSHV